MPLQLSSECQLPCAAALAEVHWGLTSDSGASAKSVWKNTGTEFTTESTHDSTCPGCTSYSYYSLSECPGCTSYSTKHVQAVLPTATLTSLGPRERIELGVLRHGCQHVRIKGTERPWLTSLWGAQDPETKNPQFTIRRTFAWPPPHLLPLPLRRSPPSLPPPGSQPPRPPRWSK